MAQFCTKCGAPLGEGLKFCTGCGATVGGPSAPAAQAPAPPAPAAAAPRPAPAAVAPSVAPAAPAAAPAASSGSPVVKIVLIVLAVLILLGLLSAGACVYMVYRAKQKVNQLEKQVQTTFPTPAGTGEVHPQPVAPAAAPTPPAGPVVDTGVPIYPGATPWGGGTLVAGPTTSMKSQQYTTSDSVDQVMAFYKDKLGSTAMVTQSGGQVVVQTLGANGGITVGITSDAALGKTKIAITSIGK